MLEFDREASKTKAHFVPETVCPSEKPLGIIQYFKAASRNLLETFDTALFDLPYRQGQFLWLNALLVVDPAMMEEMLLTKVSAFERGKTLIRLLKPAMPEGMLVVEGEVWKHQRRAAAPGFRQQALDALVPDIRSAAMGAVKALESAGDTPIDVHRVMTAATFAVIHQVLLGGSPDDTSKANVIQAINEYVETGAKVDLFLIMGLPSWFPRPGASRAARAVTAMKEFGRKALATRRALQTQPPSDLLQLLIDARDPETGKGLSDGEIVDNILTFISAGHETTSLALTWALYLVANAPEIQDSLALEIERVCGDGPVQAHHLAHLDLHDRVIKEAMRLYPPAAVIQRETREKVVLGELNLPAGVNVSGMIYVIHRSRLLWDRPEAFDPERFLPEASRERHRFAFMPFGGGARICIGARFAMMEAIVILAETVRATSLRGNPSHKVRPVLQVSMRPEGGMPLYVTPRQPVTRLTTAAAVH